jgi:Tfp pilus assembly PilM family ATPase/uncharacterized membrane protein YgcG
MANFLGIEIGPDAIRAALIKTALRKVQIARYVEVPIVPLAGSGEPAPAPMLAMPPSEAFPAAITPPAQPPLAPPTDPVHAAMREVLRQIGPPPPSIIVAMPGEESSIRRIELPAAAAKKIDELLPFEMEALVPFDAEETVLDHQPIGIDDGKVRILVVAVPKERIRGQLAQLAAWGADPQELAVGAAGLDGLSLLVPALTRVGPELVIHLGGRRTDLCIVGRGRPELGRTISAGALDVADVSFAGASGSPYASDAPPDRETFRPRADVMSTFRGSTAERLGRELKQTIAAWRMQGGAPITHVHVAGIGLSDPRMIPWLADVLGQPVELLALPDATPPSGLDAESRARFALALSLAARPTGKGKRIDLRKGEFVARRTSGWVRQHAPLLASCAAAIVVSFFFSVYARWSVLEARRESLEAQLADVTRSRLGEETRSPSRARSLLETGGARSDPMPRFTAYEALGAISAAIPADISHDVQRLHIDLGDDRSGGHFELAGVVGTLEERDRIAHALGEVACFRELDSGPITQAPNNRRTYRIEADILCPGEDGATEGPTKRGGSGRSRSSSSGGSGGGSSGGRR